MLFIEEQIRHITTTTSKILYEQLPATYKMVTYSIKDFLDEKPHHPNIAILKGIIGSGKSTLLKQLAQRYNSYNH